MTRDLRRLLSPRSVAVIGGGAWCRAVVRGLRDIGFVWDVWPVHPHEAKIEGVRAYPSVDALPRAPDAAFVGVNRAATVEVVGALARQGAGGAICFASGFAEVEDGKDLTAALLQAAGEMPIVGPNCYGFINAQARASLWPDIHGLSHVERGVAILAQSSNIALNLTMQTRGLPIAMLGTVGNQAQTGIAELGAALLADDHVTALGLYIEGVGDLRAFEALSAQSQMLGKPVVVLKTGRSAEAQMAAVSHTAALSGQDRGATALFERLGMARVDSLEALLETLKLLHFIGPLPASQIASLSCSGGEASLVADAAAVRGIGFAPLSDGQRERLRAELGPMVTLSNPLDYHTFIWGNTEAMTGVFTHMMQGGAVLTLVIVDFPHAGRCSTTDWESVITAAADAHAHVGMPLALVSTLPETMPEDVVARLVARGVIPMAGLEAAMDAIAAAAALGRPAAYNAPLLLPKVLPAARLLEESAAKDALAQHGLDVPRGRVADGPAGAEAAALDLACVALKRRGLAHKTDAGGIRTGLSTSEVRRAAEEMGGDSFLVEEMVEGGLAELLVGVVADPAHGYVLTLGAGGTQTELLADSTALLLPVRDHDIVRALERLRIAPLFAGFRGQPPLPTAPVVNAVLAIQDYVTAQAGHVIEVEVNPLILTHDRAVAADALIRLGEDA
ncbi:acetate--CoA ligase family protein [Thalassococcus sp. BH17M4-6]|uniref:acetate--CoA ligase family protein n=1 Tax=Thalassococcus sp. BH17M4-6 TaxID=3413148 RepID=UPI003BD45A56